MTEQQPVYYQPPEHHNQHIKKMIAGLSVFFISLIVLVVVFVLNAHRVVVHLPFSAEKQFVRPYETFARFLNDDEVSIEEQTIEYYLQTMVDNLAGDLAVPDDYILTVHYLVSDTVNAFATVGGHIFVFRGLLEAMPDENSLAMVLAHEIAHIKHRDPVISLGRGLAIQMIYSFVTGDYSRKVDLVGYGSEIGLLYFSREQERASDIAAIEAIQKRYGHVEGYDRVFLIMDEMLEGREDDSPEWLSTHPELKQRIADLAAYAEENGWRRGDAIAMPEEVLAAVKKTHEVKKQEGKTEEKNY